MEYVITLPVVEGKAVYIIQGEASDVDLSCLAVGYGNAVISYGGMLCSQAADGYGFQSANASIVFYSYSCKVFYSIGNL